MPYSLYCSDLGMDCDHVSEGKTEEELKRDVQEHVKNAHGIKTLPHDIQKRIDRLVKEDKAA